MGCAKHRKKHFFFLNLLRVVTVNRKGSKATENEAGWELAAARRLVSEAGCRHENVRAATQRLLGCSLREKLIFGNKISKHPRERGNFDCEVNSASAREIFFSPQDEGFRDIREIKFIACEKMGPAVGTIPV